MGGGGGGVGEERAGEQDSQDSGSQGKWVKHLFTT